MMSQAPNQNHAETTDSQFSKTDGATPVHSRPRIFRNTVAMGVGSNLNALGRLVVLALIVRTCGATLFAWYVLLVEILKIVEWLVDFGTTEVFVREMNRRPEAREHLLRLLTAMKLISAPAACVVLGLTFVAMQYPASVVRAGLLGVFGLISYGAIVIYRAIYRADLSMEREIGAEMLSVVTLMVAVLLIVGPETSLLTLFACFIGSRVLFSILCVLFGRSAYRPSIRGVKAADLRWGFHTTVLIGAIGFMLFVYQSVEFIILSKFGDEMDLAFYSGAQRLAWPLLMLLGAIGATMYSVLAVHWPDARKEFIRVCQRGFDTVLLVGGVALSPLIAAPTFFIGLLGEELVPGAPALQVIAVLCLLKAISMTVGSTLYVVHAQRLVFVFVGIALLVKIPLIIYAAPRYGFMGVVYAALLVELLLVALPSLFFVWRQTGFLPGWSVALRVILAGVIAIGGARWVLPDESLWTAVLAGVIYVIIVLASGAVRWSELRSLGTRRG